MMLTISYCCTATKVEDTKILKEYVTKLLWMFIDSDQSVNDHIKTVCKKGNQKNVQESQNKCHRINKNARYIEEISAKMYSVQSRCDKYINSLDHMQLPKQAKGKKAF